MLKNFVQLLTGSLEVGAFNNQHFQREIFNIMMKIFIVMANLVCATFSASDRQKRDIFRSDINDFCPKDCLCLSEIQVRSKA